MKSHTVTSVFAGVLRKQGFTVINYDFLDSLEFENKYLEGTICFNNKEVKPHRVRWIMKYGYELFDVPMGKGHFESNFKKVGDLMDFLQRRLVWKKQY